MLVDSYTLGWENSACVWFVTLRQLSLDRSYNWVCSHYWSWSAVEKLRCSWEASGDCVLVRDLYSAEQNSNWLSHFARRKSLFISLPSHKRPQPNGPAISENQTLAESNGVELVICRWLQSTTLHLGVQGTALILHSINLSNCTHSSNITEITSVYIHVAQSSKKVKNASVWVDA